MTATWGQIYEGGSLIRLAAICDQCGNVSIANGPVADPYGDSVDLKRVITHADSGNEELVWDPKVGHAPTVDDVPDHIARAAREAYSSSSVQNNMAAILMARTVVEATAKSKGIDSGNLASKINKLRDGGFIRPAIAEQAHEVRFMGNDMAHGDIDEAPDAIDAEEILALMSEVLSEVFQGPARLERIRKRRTDRKL